MAMVKMSIWKWKWTDLPLFQLLTKFNLLLDGLQQLTVALKSFDASASQIDLCGVLACGGLVAHLPRASDDLVLGQVSVFHVPTRHVALLPRRHQLHLFQRQLLAYKRQRCVGYCHHQLVSHPQPVQDPKSWKRGGRSPDFGSWCCLRCGVSALPTCRSGDAGDGRLLPASGVTATPTGGCLRRCGRTAGTATCPAGTRQSRSPVAPLLSPGTSGRPPWLPPINNHQLASIMASTRLGWSQS